MADMTVRPTTLSPALKALDAAKVKAQGGAADVPVDGGSFSVALKQALDRVSTLQKDSTGLAREFQLGNPQVGLEEVMVESQKANVAFSAAVQVRQRLVAVYSEIMSMNV